MDQDNAKLLREKELEFFGTVTASLSHEINNVIAIVGQLAGLLDDLLYSAQQGRPLNEEKLKDLSIRLGKQVEKGKGIIKRLNRFAHSADEPLKRVDVRELLQQVIAIAERFAFLKGVALESSVAPDGQMMVLTNPFSLQQAVFLCIRQALSSAQKNDVIKIALSGQPSGVRFSFAGFPAADTSEADQGDTFLSILVKELGGNIERAAAPNAEYSIALFIPQAGTSDSIRSIPS